MRYVLIGLLLLSMVGLVGCAQVRTWTLEASQEDMANAVVTRQVADNLMSTWSLNSGTMQCGMEDFLPPLMAKKITAIDGLVKTAGKWSDVDYQKGCFLGRMGNLTYEQAREIFNKLAPLIIKAVGM